MRTRRSTEQRRTRTRAGRRTRLRRPAPEATDSRLYLRSIDRSVELWRALDDPAVGLLITEDACWQAGLAAWQSRRPAWWRWAERREWATGRAEFAAKRARIRAMAFELQLIGD